MYLVKKCNTCKGIQFSILLLLTLHHRFANAMQALLYKFLVGSWLFCMQHLPWLVSFWCMHGGNSVQV